MPRGYRLFILAAVGWLILAGAAGPKDQQGQSAKTEAHSHQSVTPGATVKPPNRPDNAETSHQQCEDNGGSKSDCTIVGTKASVDQARYAKWQAYAAAFGAVVGALTLFAAVAAAIFARSAAIHTNRNVKATMRAALHARKANEITKASQRAWVVCDNIILLRPVDYFTDRYQFGVNILIKNVGFGLARNFRVHVELIRSGEFEPRWFALESNAIKRFETFSVIDRKLGMPVAPGQQISHRWYFGGPTDEHPSAMELSSALFYLIGYLDYVDHFGRTQTARFAFHPDADSVSPWDHFTLVRAGNIGDAT